MLSLAPHGASPHPPPPEGTSWALPPEPKRDAESLRGSRRSSRRLPRRAAVGRRSFTSTLKALDELAASGAQHLGAHHRPRPRHHGARGRRLRDAAGRGPRRGAAAHRGRRRRSSRGALDPLEIIERSSVDPVAVGGVWQHLKAPALPLTDLAVLTASTGDALAANALIARVGLPAVRARIEQLGLGALGAARPLPRRARTRRCAALRARLRARARRAVRGARELAGRLCRGERSGRRMAEPQPRPLARRVGDRASTRSRTRTTSTGCSSSTRRVGMPASASRPECWPGRGPASPTR